MNLNSFVSKSLIAVAFIFVVSATVNACRCEEPTACEANGHSDAVFTGVVERTWWESKIIKESDEPDAQSIEAGSSVAVIRVSERFRGIEGETVEVRGEGSTCDYQFKPRLRYLVYAMRRGDGTLYSGTCSRTRPLSSAAEDLDYLRSVRSLQGGTVTGKLSYQRSDKATFWAIQTPMRNAEVILVSADARFRAKTDREGNFELAKIPAGRYRVHTSPATNASSLGVYDDPPRSSWDLEVSGFGCQTVWFAARPAGVISGRFVLADGTPAKDESAELVPVGAELSENKTWRRGLDANGQFRFEFLPPGRYYLGINLEGGASLDSPFPSIYYPGVLRREAATVIELKPDQELTGYDLKLVDSLPRRTLAGIARWADGRPAAGVPIQLDNPSSGFSEGSPVTTDADGRFSIEGMEGQTYELSALIHDGVPLVNSVPIRVTLAATNAPVELIVRLPKK